jgi:hypothetical protein
MVLFVCALALRSTGKIPEALKARKHT